MQPQFQTKLVKIIRMGRAAALGTSRNGTASVSMVPYVFTEDLSVFHMLTSDLALHTQDMQKDKNVSLLIMELDDGRDDPLTLARVELRGQAEAIMAGEPGYSRAKKLYVERFPKAAPLFEFDDFRLWRVKVKGGRFVAGFAKAFNLTTQSLIAAARHVDETSDLDSN